VTRAAAVPAELSSLSHALSDVAPDLRRTASQLGDVALPELPPALAAVVSDALGSVGHRLRNAALTIERERLDVDRRVYWLAIAGEGDRLMAVFRRLPPVDPDEC
jgi:hypothetical protein